MADYDIGQTTTTDLKGSVLDVKIASRTPDAHGDGQAMVRWNFPDAPKHLGYYQSIPELKSALHVLAQRVCGLGYEVDSRTKAILENITGTGNESFISIIKQLLIEKKLFGDAIAEKIRNDKGTLINLKKLYIGDIEVFYDNQGLIDHYEQHSNVKGGKPKRFEPHEIFHLTNDRISNEIHGTSVIDSLKVYIDFYNEMLSDERKIRHRELAMGMLRVQTNDQTKINQVISKYKKAIKDGEVLVVGDGVELLDNPVSPRDRIQIMQFVISQFYQVVGTPKILVTSEGYTEAGGKAGLIAFEPNEIAEKLELEAECWNQLALRIRFSRSPSILPAEQQTQAKNTGQASIQPNEAQVSANRTE